VEGSKTYSLNEGTYRTANDRLYYTPKSSGEQAYTIAVEACTLKLNNAIIGPGLSAAKPAGLRNKTPSNPVAEHRAT